MKDFEKEYQFKQLISVPIRITPRNSSEIDTIFTDMENIISHGTLDILNKICHLLKEGVIENI